jgi:hypothetical protein
MALVLSGGLSNFDRKGPLTPAMLTSMLRGRCAAPAPRQR